MNADIKRFIVSDDGIPRLYHTDETHVGKTISTKAIGNNDREDITDQVHIPESREYCSLPSRMKRGSTFTFITCILCVVHVISEL